jgi:amidase
VTPAEYILHDASSLATLIRRGDVTAREVLDCAIVCADRAEPALHAIAHRLDAAARDQTASLSAGPFTGVPFLVKDTGAAVAGAPMTSGSRLFAGNRTETDSTLVSRYRTAGLVSMGKTNTPELGLSFTTEPLAQGPTHNPWDLARSPGGSSGGSAAAVAAGIVPMAHASDGAGSIRLPAAHCGLFGFKPSRMRNPVGPAIGEALAGMSSAHCVSRSVRDSAALLDASAGEEPGDPYAAPNATRPFLAETQHDPPRLRIGVSTQVPTGTALHPACEAATQRAARLCEVLGHSVEEAALDYDAAALKSAWRTIAGVSAALGVRAQLQAHPELSAEHGLEPVNRAWMAQAAEISGFAYAESINEIRRAGRRTGRSFARFDVFLTPCTAAPAPLLGELACIDDDVDAFYDRFWAHGPFTAIYNANGCPAMTVPMGVSEEGLPVGAHFGAALGQDGLLFALAAQIERAQPWCFDRPFGRVLAGAET